MISLAFSRDDPLARSQGIDRQAFHEFIDANLDAWYGLSWIMLKRDSRQVVAAVLADDHVSTAGNEGSNAIAALIDAARQAYFAIESPPLDRLLHLHFVACAEDHRRQGLVEQLVNRCLESAAGKGFCRVIVEASGRRSRNLFAEKLGFVEKASIPYSGFYWRNAYPFSEIADHEGLVVLEKLL